MMRVLFLGGILLSTSAMGSTVVAPSHSDHHTSAPSHVMIGHVTDAATRWYDERLLVTTYTVSIDESLKGSAETSITLVLPGGVWQGWTQQAAGVPLLAVGEDILLETDDPAGVPLAGVHRIKDGHILRSNLSHPRSIPDTVQALRADVQR